MLTIGERITNDKTPSEFYLRQQDKTKVDIKVATPGIIQSFDPVEQTVTVQPAIRERVRDQYGNLSYVNLPLLVDVPVHWPRAGGLVLTFPIVQGDECLVIFGDNCMDAWWSYGDIQNPIEKRRHDLSDGYAIVGLTSQHNPILNYSTTSAQLRTEDGLTSISIAPGVINLNATTVNINGISMAAHYHDAPAGGGNTSGPEG
jgi:hypothetical protein